MSIAGFSSVLLLQPIKKSISEKEHTAGSTCWWQCDGLGQNFAALESGHYKIKQV